jgi:hypothetical protein
MVNKRVEASVHSSAHLRVSARHLTHVVMRRKIKKILIVIFILVSVVVAALPWIVYSYYLSLVDGRPTPPNTNLPVDELNRVWSENEKDLRKENLGDITPYWFYKFIVYAFANDSLGIKITDKQITAGMSEMAGFVAIWYLRDGNFKGKGMLWWHITHTSLGIWLQRNWSPEQLATSYIVWNDRITRRFTGRDKAPAR